jgi:SAM-dependent methyltransferase
VSAARYDRIGRSYVATRREEPRIAAAIHGALGDARTVLNVGAGAGAYEPRDREVTAVEPSAVMRAQRPPDAAPCIDARAEALPFADGAFDAAMAVLTLHHWTDWRAGIEELRRVARRVVVLSWDPSFAARLWISAEYFPQVIEEEAAFPSLADQVGAVRATRVTAVPIPHDCRDGFYGAYWRHPEAYLDPVVRAGISVMAKRAPGELDDGLARLAEDLRTGAWAERHADLLELEELDLGYRIMVSGEGAAAPAA